MLLRLRRSHNHPRTLPPPRPRRAPGPAQLPSPQAHLTPPPPRPRPRPRPSHTPAEPARAYTSPRLIPSNTRPARAAATRVGSHAIPNPWARAYPFRRRLARARRRPATRTMENGDTAVHTATSGSTARAVSPFTSIRIQAPNVRPCSLFGPAWPLVLSSLFFFSFHGYGCTAPVRGHVSLITSLFWRIMTPTTASHCCGRPWRLIICVAPWPTPFSAVIRSRAHAV